MEGETKSVGPWGSEGGTPFCHKSDGKLQKVSLTSSNTECTNSNKRIKNEQEIVFEGQTNSNIIKNADFSQGMEYWRRNWEHCQAEVVSSPGGVGCHYNYAIVTRRREFWHSIEQDITREVYVGALYDVSALVSVKGGEGKKFQMTATVRIDNFDSSTFFLHIGSVHVTNLQWEKLKCSFSLNTVAERVVFYLEGPCACVDLLIRHVSISPVHRKFEINLQNPDEYLTGITDYCEKLQEDVRDSKMIYELLDSIKTIESTEFEYQGFNDSRLLNTFWNKADRTNRESVMKDLFDMLTIGLLRANIREDQLAKTSSFGRERIKQLCSKYGIPLRKNVNDVARLTPHTLTFLRVICIFPLHASILIHRNNALCMKAPISGKYGALHCPMELRHIGAAALIPTSSAGFIYMLVHIAYMMELFEFIDKKTLSFGERFEKQRRCANIVQGSKIVNLVHRVAAFKAMGLDKKSVFDKVVEGANLLRRLRGHDDIDFKENGVKIVSNRVFISDSDTTEYNADVVAAAMLKRLSSGGGDSGKSPESSSAGAAVSSDDILK